MHSEKYDKVKFYFDTGRWDETKVHNAVVKGWITTKEYNDIVGAEYSEPVEEQTEE